VCRVAHSNRSSVAWDFQASPSSCGHPSANAILWRLPNAESSGRTSRHSTGSSNKE